MRPMPIAALLVTALLATPLSGQIGGALRPTAAGQVTVEAAHLESLQGRLSGFAAQLPAEERALWDGLLLRAASAPVAAGEVRVSPVLQIGPGGGCDGGPGVDEMAGRVSIVVQGGRTASPGAGIVVQGGRTPAAAPREGIVVQGGRAPSGIVVQGGRAPAGGQPAVQAGGQAPRPNPTGDGTAAIGPKQDDPGAPRPQTGAVAIGPKQDDPAPPPQSLGRRIAVFSQQLPAEERGALEWLLTRAAAGPDGSRGTPGGLPPGSGVSLRQALGIDPLAIGPKQDDPAPPPPAQRWLLRY